MAREAGLVEFISRDSSHLKIKVRGKIETYKNIKFYDFTSERKMMTRVVQNEETGEVTIMCKGADSSIFKRCLPSAVYRELQSGHYGEDSAEVKNMYKKHFSTAEMNLVTSVDEFAKHGFRTLAFASRKLDSPEIDGVYTQEEIESELTVCGVTSVEDLLQRDVAQCLNDFKKAGIKTWMLTGDKGETAKMIGLLCGMLQLNNGLEPTPNKTVFTRLNEDTSTDIMEEFNRLHEIVKQGNKLEIMISGVKLAYILENKDALDLVEKVLSEAAAVIIYRAKPLDKANVVNFIRQRNRGKITLAIGDGANDVNMIQSAHIGVGIKGKEGN